MTLLQSFSLPFSRSLLGLPAAGHLSALVLGSSSSQVPFLLQLACSSTSTKTCCRSPYTCQFSSCSSVGHTTGGGSIRSNTCNSASRSEQSRVSSTTSQFQQVSGHAVSPNSHLESQLQQHQPVLNKLLVAWAHMPQRHGAAVDARASTLMPCCSARMRCRAVAAATAAAAGPADVVRLLQLYKLLLPFGILQPHQLGVRGLSSRTADRWRPSGRQPRVLLGQLCAQAHSMQELQQLLQQYAEHVNGIAVAAAYHRAGKLCQGDPALVQSAAAGELLQHLDQLLPPVRGQLGARELANIIWSCAYTKHTTPVAQLLPDFMQPQTLSAAKSQELANVLWALATMEQQMPQQQLEQLLAALAGQDIAVPQEISISVLALGKLGYQVVQQQQLGELLATFTADGMLGRATTQAIANLLLGMAYLGQQLPEAQLQLLMTAFVSKRSRANTQEVANFLWAVFELGQQMQAEQLEKLLAAVVQQLHRTVPQDISHMLLACGRFRHLPVQLLTALQQQQHMQRFLAGANPQDLANTAWACGMLGHNSKLLLGGLLQQAVKLLKQDSSRLVCQDLCNLCWAVAVLDLRQYVSKVLQLAKASSNVWDSAKPAELQQLYQVHLWLLDHNLAAAEGGKGPGLLQVLSHQQLDECRQAWHDQVAHRAAAAPSPLQQRVFKALQQLPGWQIPPQQEVLTTDSNFSIDIAAVTAAGVRLAVEVDGPSHFISPGNRVNGPTQYRIRALTARGYTVVSIPYWQWNGLRGSEQHWDYLKGRLQGIILAAEPMAAAAPADQPPSTAPQGSRRRVRSTKRRRDNSH